MTRLVFIGALLIAGPALGFSLNLPSQKKVTPERCENPHVASGRPGTFGGDLPFPLGDCDDPNRPERPRVGGIQVPQVRESWELRWIDDDNAEALIWKEGRWLDRATLEVRGRKLIGSSRRMESFEIDLSARFLHACFKKQNGPCAVLSIKTKEM